MLFLRLLVVILSHKCAVSAVLDQQCIDNCSCCIDEKCGPNYGWSNACTNGCIDGHSGARCYELCQYPNCKSCGGITNSTVCTECYNGYYLGPNKDCTQQCPSNCKSCTSSTMCTECKEGFYDKDGSTTCKYVQCPANCECNGEGDCISCKKGYYNNFTSCSNQCPVNCLTCESDTSCNECKSGYYNGYEYDNSTNNQMNNCTYPCREACTQCQSYNTCLQCKKGKYGSKCDKQCSVGCKDNTCSFDLGTCDCTNNFTGDTCIECADGKYGSLCNETCSNYCKEHKCKGILGNCTDGCINENITGVTCNMCIIGMHGELCSVQCPKNCKNNSCERNNGTCSDGCIGNFNGTKCDTCVRGKFGMNCEQDCPVNCAGSICDKNSGTCYECMDHFDGKECNTCKPSYYGSNCNESCSLNCANFTCERETGKCMNGCLNGYSGDRCCVLSENCVECFNNTECKTCESGFYEKTCNKSCPEGCLDSCNISTGECSNCQNNRFDQKNVTSNSGLVAAAAVLGSMLMLSFSVNIVLLALFLLKKRKGSGRKHSWTEREPTYQNQLVDIAEQTPRTTRDATDTLHSETVERSVYEGISGVNEEEHVYQQVAHNHDTML